MKYILIFTLTLLTASLSAGPYCMDNSEHLRKDNDTKEWHSVECYCKCVKIKGGRCIDCNHMQNAVPLFIVKSKKISSAAQIKPTTLSAETPQEALRKFASQYLLNN